MEVRPARPEDLESYTALGREAQSWLRSRGLGQYVPAAHDEYAVTIRARLAAGILYAVADDGATVGYFSLDASPSPWWPVDGARALYLAGMVVDQRARGRGVGSFIIQWCLAQAARRGCQFVRLDCHADNGWLRGYYERHGFVLQGLVPQHPGYEGCLYQFALAASQLRHHHGVGIELDGPRAQVSVHADDAV